MEKYEFRGKSKQSGEWLFGDLLHLGNWLFIVPFDTSWEEFIINDNDSKIHTPRPLYEAVNGTVGQYTGIVDKDGNKIYEGDIVECVSWNDFFTNPDTGEVMEPFRRKMRVELREGCFKMIEKIPDPWEDHEWDMVTTKGDLTVIGNITDNPDLI